MAGETLARNDNVCIQGMVGGGGEVDVEVMKVKRLSLKIHDFCLSPKTGLRSGLSWSPEQSSLIYYFES